MNRFAVATALLIVTLVVSAASSFPSGTSLALATMIATAAILAHRFVEGMQTIGAVPARFGEMGEFVRRVVQHTLRFSFAAVAIAWTLVSLQWYPA